MRASWEARAIHCCLPETFVSCITRSPLWYPSCHMQCVSLDKTEVTLFFLTVSPVKNLPACYINNHYPSPFSKVLSAAWMRWWSRHYPEISECKVWFLALLYISSVTMCKLPPKGNMLGCKRILNLQDKVLTQVSGWKPGKFKWGKKVHICSGEGN